jgi:hypothetical protein
LLSKSKDNGTFDWLPIQRKLSGVVTRVIADSTRQRTLLLLLHELPLSLVEGMSQTDERELLRIWEDGCRDVAFAPNQLGFLQKAYLVQWHTYHFIYACTVPLSKDEAAKKDRQLKSLCECLDSLVAQFMADEQLQPFHETMATACELAKSRILESSAARHQPFAYYPLSEKVIDTARKAVEEKVHHEFIKLQDAIHKKQAAVIEKAVRDCQSGNEEHVDFFQLFVDQNCVASVQISAARVTGSIFDQWYIAGRNVSFEDAAVFPYAVPKSVAVQYRLSTGLSFELVFDTVISEYD